MATTAKRDRKRARCRRGKEISSIGADRFGEATATPRLLRSLLRADANPGPERGNENGTRPIKNCACESDHAGTSATRKRQRFTDAKSDAEKEEKGESRQEVSGRGLIFSIGASFRDVKGNLA